MSCLGSSATDPYASEREKPLREVYISSFLVCRHPTTRRQFANFIEVTGFKFSRYWDPAGKEFAELLEEGDDLPAIFISWEAAQAYCLWLGSIMRTTVCLPTEAEWEKAARGGDDRLWPWGDEFDPSLCNSAETLGRYPAAFCPVTELAEGASPYGCLHMAGGVWEWCEDFYHPYSHREASFLDPVNLMPSHQRVVKGGSAYCVKEIVRPACRDWTNSFNQGGGDDGFRVCIRTWR